MRPIPAGPESYCGTPVGIVEYTGGSTGSAWALVRAAKGYRYFTNQRYNAGGIFARISIGWNVAGALALARELGPAHTVVTVAVDTGLNDLAGDLFEM